MPKRHMLSVPAHSRLFWLLRTACALQAELQCFWLIMNVNSAVTPGTRDYFASVCT